MNKSNLTLIHGDCLEELKNIRDGSIDLVLTDPPYNIGVRTIKEKKAQVNSWDKIPNYISWCISWLKECERVLKPNGVMYFWHNDIAQVAEILVRMKDETSFTLRSFCIWDKGKSYRARSWLNRRPDGKTALRSWFNVCEYCLHFFKGSGRKSKTGLEMIMDNPNCFASLKEWYRKEKGRLGLSDREIGEKYTEATGKKPHMLRHYFCDHQFELPTQKVWEKVYEPLGFVYRNKLGKDYEAMRQDYEAMRPYHKCDALHCNIWHIKPIPSANRSHTCQKPVEILERLIRVSCPPYGVVLDCFMGSGSTGVAAVNTGRRFIGIEKEEKYYLYSKRRIGERTEAKL